MEKSNLTPELHDKLFSVICAGLDLNAVPFVVSSDDCRELIHIGSKQSILPIIYRGLKKSGAPDEVVRECDKARLRDTKQVIIQNDALQKICTALNMVHISYIPLKGAVLRELYPQPELRTSCDIDVLVKEDDIMKAVNAIESITDFKILKRNYHDISMVNADVHLELHFSLLENMENIDSLLSRVWNYVVSDENSRCKFTPEFQIFHTVAHMSYHMVHGGLGIRPFIDLWLLRTKTVYNENIVRSMCRECGILVFYEKCICLVNSWMTGMPVPKDLVILDDYAINGGVFGNRQTVLAARQREHRGFDYYFSRIFLSRNILENIYPNLKNKPFLIPFYQIRRWFRILNPKKREQVQKEIANVKALSSETIDSFDMLLNSLGL